MSNDKPPEFPGNDSAIMIPNKQTPMDAPILSITNDSLPQYFGHSNMKVISCGINPLISATDELLSLPAKLLSEPPCQNIEKLRKQVLEKINIYSNSARIADIESDVSDTARKVICAFIDEAVLNTPWSRNSIWANKRLLCTLHNEVNGGEIFFTILDDLLNDHDSNLDLLELIFICISLGFKGRYAVMDEGDEHLEELRNKIFDQIRKRRGNFSKALSPHWQSTIQQQNTLHDFIPLWVVVAVASALLLSMFLGFTLVLDNTLEPVYESLINITQNDSITTLIK